MGTDVLEPLVKFNLSVMFVSAVVLLGVLTMSNDLLVVLVVLVGCECRHHIVGRASTVSVR